MSRHVFVLDTYNRKLQDPDSGLKNYIGTEWKKYIPRID